MEYRRLSFACVGYYCMSSVFLCCLVGEDATEL